MTITSITAAGSDPAGLLAAAAPAGATGIPGAPGRDGAPGASGRDGSNGPAGRGVTATRVVIAGDVYYLFVDYTDGSTQNAGVLPIGGALIGGTAPTGAVTRYEAAGIVSDTLAALAGKADLAAVAALLASALAIVDAQKLDASMAALAVLTDALPSLPSDPTAYPDAGGWFREGDANGYRLVRILPKS